MFFFVRLILLSILGPMVLPVLEQNFFFELIMAAISVVLTVWLAIDAAHAINNLTAWTGGK